MASGQTLVTFYPGDAEYPSATPATYDTRNDHPCLDFDASTNESVYFSFVMPRNYSGLGLTISLHFGASGITTGNVIWNSAIERISDSQQDVDSNGFATTQVSAATAVPGTDGFVKIVTITHANTVTDSLVAGELGRLQVIRDAANGSDTAAADAELYAVEIRET